MNKKKAQLDNPVCTYRHLAHSLGISRKTCGFIAMSCTIIILEYTQINSCCWQMFLYVPIPSLSNSFPYPFPRSSEFTITKQNRTELSSSFRGYLMMKCPMTSPLPSTSDSVSQILLLFKKSFFQLFVFIICIYLPAHRFKRFCHTSW